MRPGSQYDVDDTLSIRFAKDSLRLAKTVFLYPSHDDKKPLAKTPKSLSISFDQEGMQFEASVSKTSTGLDLLQSIADEVVQGCSFGCEVLTRTYDEQDGREVMTITEAIVNEISPTHNPAFKATDLALLARNEWLENEFKKLHDRIQRCMNT